MTKLIGSIVLILAAVAGGYYLHILWEAPPSPARDPITHHSVNSPTIEQVQKLASLVSLRVPISDVQVTELTGLTGGVKLVMAVQGDVDIAADLGTAKFEQVDAEKKSAILVLRKPVPMRPRLDHEKTRILQIDRSGLWNWLPGETGEKTLTNRAMQSAQRILGDVAARQDLAKQACQQTEHVIKDFFAATGWQITVQWDETPIAPAAAEVPESK